MRMRAGKPGGGKGALLSEELCLTIATGNDLVLFKELSPASSQEQEELRWEWCALAGLPPASARTIPSPDLSSRRTGRSSSNSVTSRQLSLMISLMPRYGWAGSHVKTSVWQGLGRDLPDPVADSRSPFLTSSQLDDPGPSSSRMSEDFSVATRAGTSSPSKIKWGTSGILLDGAYWTRNTPLCPSDDSGCSSSPSILSTTLMDSYPDRSLVSPARARGIMTRSETRGKRLPLGLTAILERVVLKLPPLAWVARKLQPTEAERIFGYPDGWTIPLASTPHGSRPSETES